MQALAERFDPAAVESQSRAFWAGRSALSPDSRLGPRTGATTHLFIGTLFPSDDPFALWHREVLADVTARSLALAGHRSWSSVQIVAGQRHHVPELLKALADDGIHLTGDHASASDPAALRSAVQRMVDSLATGGVLVSRESAAMCCPRCLVSRTPEAIVYQEDEGPVFLIRFPLRDSATKANLLVWTDHVWKLLGTTAVAVSPSATYVTGRYRRREFEETIVLAKDAVPRLESWLPGGVFEPIAEQVGSALEGAGYVHPLSVEYPAVGTLPAPAGTIVGAPEVSNAGTGIVAMVPSHGSTDAAVAARLHLPGLPVTTADGRIERVVMHKYAGLPLEIAEAFILRDLNDGGSIFAEPRVDRGVPHCAACGSPLLWRPAWTWYLDPGKLAPGLLQEFARLMPGEPPLGGRERVGWVAAHATKSESLDDPVLLECDGCGRLAPAEQPGPCPCGGNRQATHRALATALRETLTAWARHSPMVDGDPVTLFLPDRRAAPALVHHLAAAQSLGVRLGAVRLQRVPTARAPDAPPGTPVGIDARRGALIRTLRSPRVGPTIADRERREARRLSKAWSLVGSVVDQAISDGYRPDGDALANHRGELLEEDAAFVSSFERMRAQVIQLYQSGATGEAAVVLGDFLESDLRDGYMRLVGPRFRSPGLAAPKVSAYRVLFHVLPLWTELYAPIAPFTMEALLTALRGAGRSVFEGTFTPVQETLIDPKLEESSRLWHSVIEALSRGRRMFGIGREARLASAVIVARDEPTATGLRASMATLTRLALVTQLQVASPAQPWGGAEVVATPVVGEIHRIYGTQGARVARLLEQIKPRRIQEGLAAGNLSVALDGRSVQVLPGMVEISESLPDSTVVVPWSGGEIYLTLPSIVFAGGEARPPAVSVEGSQTLRTLRRRLSRRKAPETPPRLVVQAAGALGSELSARSKSIAGYLGVAEVTFSASELGFVAAETIRGRTRRGDPWKVWVPGLEMPSRPRKRRTPRSANPRVRFVELGQESGEVDFLSEEVVHRSETIRAMVEQLDAVLGRPIVGPSKLANAWTAGIHDLDGFRQAPFELLSGVPGFGPVLAEHVLRQFGGTVPTRPPRSRPALPREGTVPEVSGPGSPEVESPGPLEAPAPVPAPPPTPSPPPTVSSPPPVVPAPVIVPDPAPAPVFRAPFEVPAPPERLRPDYVPHPPVEYPADMPAEIPPALTVPVAAAVERRFGVEVWPGPSAEPAWRRFLDLTGLGVRGLCFTREFPDRIRGAIGSRVVDIAWLSNTGRDGSVRPGDLGALQARIAEALHGSNARAVFIGGMEYLLSLHGREKVAAFLQSVSELALPARARVWVPMNPALVVPGAAEELAGQFPPEVTP